jgi:hypothetical protein
MAISDTQKVDALYKKLFAGATKTDVLSAKSPSNEAIPSPLLMRGDLIWNESGLIPAVAPATTSAQVQVYSGTASVKCVVDTTSSLANRTWKTELTRWVPPQFGSTYAVKVYVDTAVAANPQSTGTQLFPDGSGNSDEWAFDYEAGVLNFAGTNLPTAVTGKTVYIVGYRYVGSIGSTNNSSLGGLTLTGANLTNITTGTVDTDLGLSGNGTGNVTISSVANISNTTTSTSSTTGALVVAGGAGITGNINVAGNANITGEATFGNTVSITGNLSAPTGQFTDISATGNANIGNASITTASVTNLSSGNAVVTGGSIDATPIGATTPSTGDFTDLHAANAQFDSINNTPIGNAIASTGAFTTLTANGITTITNATQSNEPFDGALVVAGGVGIGKNLHVQGDTTLHGATTTIKGNLIVQGQTTTLNTQTLTVNDPLVILGEANPEDVLDLGMVVSYTNYAYAQSFAGIVRNSDNSNWVLFNDAPIVDNDVDFANVTYATLDVGTVLIKDITDSIDETTGAVVVAGGAGIAGNLHVGGDIVGNIATASQTAITQVGILNDLEVAGNIVANSSVIVTDEVVTPTVVLTDSAITSTTLVTTSTTAGQVIASVDASMYRAAEFILKAESTNKYYVATVSAVHDGANVDYAIYGTIQLPAGQTCGQVSVAYNSGNMELVVTPASSDSTTWTTQTRII